MYVFRNLFIEFFVVRRDWSYKSSNQDRILELLFIISFSHVEITENDWRVYGCDNSTISEVLRHISHVSLFAIIDEVIAFLIWFRKSAKSRPDYPINRIQVQNLISILFVHSPYSACYCLSNTTQNFFVFC